MRSFRSIRKWSRLTNIDQLKDMRAIEIAMKTNTRIPAHAFYIDVSDRQNPSYYILVNSICWHHFRGVQFTISLYSVGCLCHIS